jgi:ABC-type Na+ transport system ATPase subunit NatA
MTMQNRQDFGVYPHLDPLTLLDHFATLEGIADRGERKAMVEALLHRVNLWPVRKQRLGGFSGGMRQRFAFDDDAPGPGFAAVEPDLEDVYFTALRRSA